MVHLKKNKQFIPGANKGSDTSGEKAVKIQRQVKVKRWLEGKIDYLEALREYANERHMKTAHFANFIITIQDLVYQIVKRMNWEGNGESH